MGQGPVVHPRESDREKLESTREGKDYSSHRLVRMCPQALALGAVASAAHGLP